MINSQEERKKKDVSLKTKHISKILLRLLVQDVVRFHKKHNQHLFIERSQTSIPLRIIKCCQALFPLPIRFSSRDANPHWKCCAIKITSQLEVLGH